MFDNIAKEYLIALRAKIDNPSIKNAENAIKKLDLGMGSLLKSFGAAAGIYASAAAGLYKFATAAAKQDLALEKTARRLMASKESVRQYQNALDALGASMEDIQINPELKANFDKLINDGRRLSMSGDYAKGAKEVRSFLFEVTRLKQEISYAMQWAGYHITKNLIAPFQKGKQSLSSLNETIIRRIPELTANVGRIAGQVGQVFSNVVNFFGQVINGIKDFWSGLPDWAKKAAMAGGIIGLIAFGMTNPVAGLAMLIGAIMLLIDDYVSWQQGKKAVFGQLWTWLQDNVGGVKDAVSEFVKSAIQGIGNFLKWCGQTWPKLTQFWTDLNKTVELSFRDVMNFFDAIPKWAEDCVRETEKFFNRLGKGFEIVGWITTHPAKAIEALNAGADFWNLLPGSSDNVDEDIRRRGNEARARYRAENGSRIGNSDNAYDSIIWEAAEKNGVSPALIKAIIKKESGFNPNAVSAAGAQGLGQLMPETARGLGVNNPFDARENIFGVAKYLKELSNNYGFKTAGEIIAAYNAGPGNVLKAGGIPDFSETQAYVPEVLKSFNEYQKNLGTKSNRMGGVISKYKQLAQNNGISCGQTSVASTINLLKGTNYQDSDINRKYGFGLLNALNQETGMDWSSPDFSPKLWGNIENSVNAGFPVSIGLGGRFTSSNGHIMNIVGIDGNDVILGDPNGGKYQRVSKREIERVQGHSEGKFLFMPSQFLNRKTASLNLGNFASAGMGMMNALSGMAPVFSDTSTALAGSNINITNGNIIINVASTNASAQEIAGAVSDAYGSMQRSEYYSLSRTLNNAWMG